MTLAGVLLRFFAAYLGLLMLAVLGLRVLDIEGHAGVNVAALIGAVFWPSLSFGRRNGRPFTKSERRQVIFGMMLIDLLLQAGLSLAAHAAQPQSVAAGPVVIAFGLIAALHLAVVSYCVSFCGRLWSRQHSQGEKRAGGQPG